MSVLSEPSSLLQMPVDICGAVLEFADPRDWFLHARLSANHYESFTKHISRMLGVSEAQANAALHFFDEGQWSAVETHFKEWMDQTEKRMILIPQGRFPLLLGYPCIRELKRYTGRVRVKSLDESYWQDNYPDGGSDAIQWEIIGRGWENPIHLRNLKDLTEVEFGLEGEKSMVDQNTLFQNDSNEYHWYSVDSTETHQLTLLGEWETNKCWAQIPLPLDIDDKPQLILREWNDIPTQKWKKSGKGVIRRNLSDLVVSENYKCIFDCSNNQVICVDVRSSKEQCLMNTPFKLRRIRVNCNQDYIALEQELHGGLLTSYVWWIVDLKNGQWISTMKDHSSSAIFKAEQCDFKWINPELFIINCKIETHGIYRLRCVSDPCKDLAVNGDINDLLSETTDWIPVSHILWRMFGSIIRRNLVTKSYEELFILDWE